MNVHLNHCYYWKEVGKEGERLLQWSYEGEISDLWIKERTTGALAHHVVKGCFLIHQDPSFRGGSPRVRPEPRLESGPPPHEGL